MRQGHLHSLPHLSYLFACIHYQSCKTQIIYHCLSVYAKVCPLLLEYAFSCEASLPYASHIPDNDAQENCLPSILSEFTVHDTDGNRRIWIIRTSNQTRARQTHVMHHFYNLA